MKFKYTLIFLLFIILQYGCTSSLKEGNVDEWNQAEQILNNITPPSFPDKVYNITAFGAVGDGISDCSNSFKEAIDSCSNSGGGKVVVPAGTFLTGPLHLKSNVNLYVSENAVVKFTTDKSKYLPVVRTMWEGMECMNYSPLIYAYEQHNIAVTGKGILDGQGSNENWWNWKGKKEYGWKENDKNQNNDRNILLEMAENNVPYQERIFGDGHYLRPNFFQLFKCQNILVADVTFKNSPMWFLHPVQCSNISILNVIVEGLGPNNDGCDPESSKDILIKNCFFNTGDDCIAIKSGRNADGRRINIPSENIIIQNCIMKEGHGGVVIGSEISGGVRNVFAENCEMSSPNLDRAIRIKTNSIRGGVIENIFIRNIKVGQVKEAVILIDFFYEEGDKGKFDPIVKNIKIKDLTSDKSGYALWLKGYKRDPITNLYFENCSFNDVEKGNIIENTSGITFDNVTINGQKLKNQTH